jgi:hypothetical protein
LTAVAALTAALALASVTSAAAGTTSGATSGTTSGTMSGARPAVAKPDAVTNDTWTGYVLVGHSEGFRQVTGKFKIPPVSCTSPGSKASFWIGLDGYNYGTAHSSTVEQVGISTNCSNSSPQVRAFWEMAPNGTQLQFNVVPGDTISMLVKYVGGAWNLALTDLTHNDNAHKFNVTEKCPSGYVCENMSAEAVLEADGGNNLSNFTSATFSEFQAIDSSGASTGLVADGSYWGLAEVLMTGNNGQNLADAGPITNNGENYTLTYRQAN